MVRKEKSIEFLKKIKCHPFIILFITKHELQFREEINIEFHRISLMYKRCKEMSKV